MKKPFYLVSLLLGILLLVSCNKEMPLMEDGTLTLKVIVVDISKVIPIDSSLGYAPVPMLY